MTDDTALSASASWGEPRSKTVTWYDPVATAQAGARMSGLEYLRAIVNGELPEAPMGKLFGGTSDGKVSEGRIEFSCLPDESTYNPIGIVHGGLVCFLLDSAAGSAVHTTLPAGVGYTSIEIKVNYLRSIHADTGRIYARGWVTKPGRRVAFAEADVRDSAGKVLATASSSLLILSPSAA
ncbi:PaaI family thioesterase [Nocardia transvalensis]|uniref:PaaI family thioesterase n=1 Tax=Nocardia transvalensis TaxID=37333 RepID=UPI001894C90C|nr:PaaI family thioesterase [Nocardia transvalensis]MBF6334119.1 PaaI family thioesterase [Nocardia transvalensis]